jgi:hypothetical protein
VGLRDDRWKLIHEMNSERSKLFDLLEDPAERFDLSRQRPDFLTAYRVHLLRWCGYQRDRMNAKRPPFRDSTGPPKALGQLVWNFRLTDDPGTIGRLPRM